MNEFWCSCHFNIKSFMDKSNTLHNIQILSTTKTQRHEGLLEAIPYCFVKSSNYNMQGMSTDLTSPPISPNFQVNKLLSSAMTFLTTSKSTFSFTKTSLNFLLTHNSCSSTTQDKCSPSSIKIKSSPMKKIHLYWMAFCTFSTTKMR